MISIHKTLISTLVLYGCLLCSSMASGKSFTLTILTDKKVYNLKRTVEIRLDRRISHQQLEALAHKIKALDSISYNRLFILYYLPHQKLGAGAWATTHFTPELEVEISGATVDDVKKLQAYSATKGWQTPPGPRKSLKWGDQEPVNLQYGGDIIGEWIWDFPVSKMTLLRKDGHFFINEYYRGGGQNTVRVRAEKVKRGLKVQKFDPGPYNEFFIINKNGELEVYDSDHDLKRGNLLIFPPEPKGKAL